VTRSDRRPTATRPRMPLKVLGGMSMGIGSLPHLSLVDAITLSLSSTDIVTIPSLPKRSPAESMIAQALIGIDGVSVGQYGSIAVDPARVNVDSPVVTHLDHDAFGGFRSFLDYAEDFAGPVKWQMVGPVTLGLSLMRAGVAPAVAFDVAVRAVRTHAQNLLTAVAEALPHNPQIVVLDEPEFGAVRQPGFPVPPDVAVDLLSGALAVIEPVAISGVHCCGDADWASLMSAGPALVSMPAHLSLLESAGYIQRFLERGGWIAWGAVPTDGPIPISAERPWKKLCDLWCQLVQRGCSPALLRQQSLITPECGLGLHSPAVAERVLRINGELSARVRDQAAATRFAFGA
jgi:hypothetical protein